MIAPAASGWWAEAGPLALERDGTVWRIADDGAARPIGRIDRGGGLDLSLEESAAWDELAAGWEDAIREYRDDYL